VTPVECLATDYLAGTCDREVGCLSRPVWQRVKNSVDQVLDSMTLADLCAEVQGTSFVPIEKLTQPGSSDPCSIAGDSR
jgi:DNA-binding IscR family transcriptional regulator